MTLKDFIKLTNALQCIMGRRPTVICEDGYRISIQAGPGFYCATKEMSNTQINLEVDKVATHFPPKPKEILSAIKDLDYINYEVGLTDPSEQYDGSGFLDEYAEQPGSFVCPFVPSEKVEELLKMHGGIKTFDTKEVREKTRGKFADVAAVAEFAIAGIR